jgi:hypothetical protein
MKFRVLQDNLRNTIWERIEEGDLTGLRLAQQTGFKQAHISNFLNRKRGLSLEGMDRVLAVQHLSVLDLLEPSEINKRASILPPSNDEFQNVLLTEGTIAATQPLITSMHVKEILKFRKTFLKKLKPETESGERQHWERFVVIKVDGREGMSMYPRLLPGATLLIDRHYNSLKPYRKGEFNMYAVLKRRYVHREVRGNGRQSSHSAAAQSGLSYRCDDHGRGQVSVRLPGRPCLPRRDRNLGKG